MSDWPMARLGDVLSYEQPTKYIVHSTYYNNAYHTPVLTAGQSFILGYTNETDNIFADNLPVIIFDDFTTAIKYVDFPFKVKSSAMKILKARKGISIKYLFYCMSKIVVDTELHKRYWISVFSNIQIPLPPLEIQRKIAATLDAASDIIKLRKKQLEELDELAKSQFIEMFGDPATNPMGWERKTLGESCEIITGNTPPRVTAEYYGEFIEWIKTDNIQATNAKLSPAKEHLSEKGFEKCRYVEAGSILMTCIAGSLNSIGNVAITDRRVAFNQQINALTPLAYDIVFLYCLLGMMKRELCESVNMMLKGILSKGRLSEIEAIAPPLELQTRFADFVRQADKSKFVIQQAVDETQMLFDSLMSGYFG